MVRSIIRSLLGPARPAVRRTAIAHLRPQLEVLDERALPNAVPLQALIAGVEHNLADVGSDVQAINKALGSNVSSAVSGDLTTITSDLSKITGDITSGTSASADITTLTTDLKTLTTDVGTTAGHRIQNQVRDLSRDVTALGNGLSRLTGSLSGQVTTIQNDVKTITSDLGAGTARPSRPT